MSPVLSASTPADRSDALGASLARAVLARMHDDALAYNKHHKLGLGNKLTYRSVSNYVEDSDNPDKHRIGLMDAWNEARDATHQYYIETPEDLEEEPTNPNPYHYSTWDTYRDFDKDSTGISIPIFGSTVSATFKRGAPKIGSNKQNWGKSDLGDSYVDYIAGLRAGGMTDVDIAEALLAFDEDEFKSHLERRAAAMLTVTVYLAEEWRKQGAAKIYRALLRRIAAGKMDFDDFLTQFEFIPSADEGRKMVGRFYDRHRNPKRKLSGGEKKTAEYLSDEEDDDYSSDEDTRENKSAAVKKKRRFAKEPPTKRQRTTV